jgi:hypothetical protein
VQQEDGGEAEECEWRRRREDLVRPHLTRVAIVVGKERPAMSISWEQPLSEADSGFCIIFSELDPLDPEDDTPSTLLCLGCLMEDGDVQLGRGLDLAREHGRVDWMRYEWVPVPMEAP